MTDFTGLEAQEAEFDDEMDGGSGGAKGSAWLSMTFWVGGTHQCQVFLLNNNWDVYTWGYRL